MKIAPVRRTRFDAVFDGISTLLLVLALLVVLYPLYFVFIASISDATSISTGQVILLPKNLSLVGYKLSLIHILGRSASMASSRIAVSSSVIVAPWLRAFCKSPETLAVPTMTCWRHWGWRMPRS